jgi:segregation and condensation protein A
MADVESTGHSVKLETLDFEGPLDLLVYLVKKNEVDIYDIPIALITEQFLEYVEAMTREKLESAGEFLLMAATLMRIKAQMLLPQPDLDDEELEDPRRELVLKIIEYQQFKEIAEHLRDHESSRRLLFSRGYREWLAEDEAEQAARDRVHHLEPLAVTIEEKVDFIRGRLRQDGRSSFRELFVVGEPRSHWIVTFVALLEMAREGEIRLRQAERFGDINVFVGEGFKK